MKLIETPTKMLAENAQQGSETGRKYWDAYDIAQRRRPSWQAVLAFFGLRVDHH